MTLKIPSLALIAMAIMLFLFGISIGVLLSQGDTCSDSDNGAIFITHPDSHPSFLLEASIDK